MRIYYYKDPNGNFGDDLNNWIWNKILPSDLSSFFDNETTFLGIGSILDRGIPDSKKLVVLGSGYAYSDPAIIDERWRIYFVRGPLTATALKIDQSYALTDGAILGSSFYQSLVKTPDKVSFMPHHKNSKLAWEKICDDLDIQYISPSEKVDKVLEKLARSKHVITEAMHGAIVADAMRIPWTPVFSCGGINLFKWEDWSRSMNIDISPESIAQPISSIYSKGLKGKLRIVKNYFTCKLKMNYLKKNGKHYLSSDATFKNRFSQCQNALEDMIKDGINSK